MNDSVQVSERDRERLLALISEYAEKLRQACDRYLAVRMKSAISIGLAFAATFLFAGFFAYGLLVRDHSDQHFGLTLAYGIFLSAIGVSADGFLLRNFILARKQNHFGMIPIRSALERLVSRAAFLEDHVASNEDDRLIITLRLAEGEAALEYAAWVLNNGRTVKTGGPSRQYRSQVASL